MSQWLSTHPFMALLCMLHELRENHRTSCWCGYCAKQIASLDCFDEEKYAGVI